VCNLRQLVCRMSSWLGAWAQGQFSSIDTTAILYLFSQYHLLQLVAAPVLSNCSASFFLSRVYNIRCSVCVPEPKSKKNLPVSFRPPPTCSVLHAERQLSRRDGKHDDPISHPS
jgi:hypothetical protein